MALQAGHFILSLLIYFNSFLFSIVEKWQFSISQKPRERASGSKVETSLFIDTT